MEYFGNNPFGLLTILVAPAILTNATSILLLSTSNRFGFAIDRVKSIAVDLELRQRESRPGIAQRSDHLTRAQRRVLLLVWGLTTLYVSVGSFVAANLIALLGALLFVAHLELLRQFSLVLSLIAGATGVGGLVAGCVLLIRESRMALSLLTDEIDFLAQHDYAASSPLPGSQAHANLHSQFTR